MSNVGCRRCCGCFATCMQHDTLTADCTISGGRVSIVTGGESNGAEARAQLDNCHCSAPALGLGCVQVAGKTYATLRGCTVQVGMRMVLLSGPIVTLGLLQCLLLQQTGPRASLPVPGHTQMSITALFMTLQNLCDDRSTVATSHVSLWLGRGSRAECEDCVLETVQGSSGLLVSVVHQPCCIIGCLLLTRVHHYPGKQPACLPFTNCYCQASRRQQMLPSYG
jgi:hypothetical protein